MGIALRILVILASVLLAASAIVMLPRTAASSLPSTLTLPSPHIGDKGIVTLTHVSQDGALVETLQPESTAETFLWMSEGSVPNATGADRAVARLLELPGPLSASRDASVRQLDVSSGRTVTYARVDVSSIGGHTFYNRTFSRFVTDVDAQGYSTSSPLCGLSMPGIQGTELDLTRDAVLFPTACSLPRLDGVSPIVGLSFHATKSEVVGSTTAVAFASLPDGRATIWLSPDYPYPLRVSLAVTSATHQSEYDVYRLSQMDRGTQTIEGPATSSAHSRPAAVPTPREPWGPPEGTYAQTFPISEAYSLALNDTSNPALADFIDQHPGAYASAANYGENLGGPQDLREWHLTISDGHEELMVGVFVRNNYTSTNVPEIAPVATLGARIVGLSNSTSAQRDVTFSYSVQKVTTDQAVPPPDLAPIVFLSYSDVAALWKSYAGDTFSGLAPNTVAFSVTLERCETPAGACDMPLVELTAGYKSVTRSPEGPTVKSSILTVDGSGRALSIDETQTTPVPPDPSTSIQWNSGLLTVSSAPIGASLSDLSLPISVGIALTIVLLFILTLKTGAFFSLYSRVLPTAEENETRARIRDIIAKRPGINLAAIARAVGAPESTARHHLRKLVGSGGVMKEKLDGFTVFKLRTDRAEVALSTVLRSAGSQNLVRALLIEPGASGRRLSALSKLNPATVTYHVARLRRHGLVEAVRAGKELRVTLTNAAQVALHRGGATESDPVVSGKSSAL